LTPPLIVVAGSLAQQPFYGGHAWVFLQYLLGLRRLGFRVIFVDLLEPEMCTDGRGRPAPMAESVNTKRLVAVMRAFGLGDEFALLSGTGESIAGNSRRNVLEQTRRSTALLNVMGFLRDEEILSAAGMRVFLDIDPGFPQMWHELGLADILTGHDAFVTIGENIGSPHCTVPTCGLAWITTRQPVVLEWWPSRSAPPGAVFATIGAWRGPFAPIEYDGRTYGLRVHEFRAFAGLPGRTGRRFEAALDIHPDDSADRALLASNGWTLVEPRRVTGDPWAYRAYVAAAAAELMVAKGMYVSSGSGWFSDRSVCFLATGRPVLAQDTGFRELYPTGLGLVPFSTLDEAAAGVDAISADYGRHARAARALAEEHFDSDKVLKRLLRQLEVG
jgi:hypothetical protein